MLTSIVLGFDLRDSLKRKSSIKCDITYTLGFSLSARSVTVQYYDLIISACFVKAMEEGRELANNCVCQNLSVFSITTSSQRNPRPTLDCNSSPARYAQILWPKLIFCYSDLRTLFNLCVTLMIVMVNFFIFFTVLPTPIRSTFLYEC